MFKTFPEFSKLTLADREEYESYIKDFPPTHDISFTALMTWWNTFGGMAVSKLNGNLVIPYWLPGDDKHSGLSLVGTNDIDESLCILFDYLRLNDQTARLINVPDFVVSNVKYPELFSFKGDRRHDEYILPVAGFYPVENMTPHRRNKIKKQMARIKNDEFIVRTLDLGKKANKDFLWQKTLEWQPKGINNYGRLEQDAMKICIYESRQLDLQNACLFVGDTLYGFCLYEVGHDKRYASIRHVKATHVTSLGFELIAYKFAEWFSESGILYGNISSDFGLLRLRMFMLTLGPHNFFRKYIIEPKVGYGLAKEP